MRLWGEHLARLHASFEATLDTVPELDVDRTLLHRRYGREALQAALDVLERSDLAGSRSYLDTALAKDPSLQHDRRAVLLRATLPLGRPATLALVGARRASWWVNRRLPPANGGAPRSSGLVGTVLRVLRRARPQR